MRSGSETQAMARVERFLADHPDGHLHVVTGFASMAGLAWLALRTANRPVTLVIGDLRTGMDNFNASDAAKAPQFISRPDVRLLNWYRSGRNKKGAAIAHSKVFAVEGRKGRPIAVLAGSANLTMAGLTANVETMVEAVQTDRDAAFEQVIWLEGQGWDASERLLAKVQPTVEPREAAGAGCLPVLLSTLFTFVKLAVLGRHTQTKQIVPSRGRREHILHRWQVPLRGRCHSRCLGSWQAT